MSEIGFSNKRYEYFVRRLEKLRGDLSENKINDEARSQEIHLSDLLDRESVREILEGDDLSVLDSFETYVSEIQMLDDDDLQFEDFPSANDWIRESEEKHVACAKVLALNESFAGFIRVFEYFCHNHADIERFVGLNEQQDQPEYVVMLALEETLSEDIPGLPAADARDAAYWVYGMLRLT
jgi:hypothetical protein